MRIRFLPAILLSMALASEARSEDKTQEESTKFQGAWQILTGQVAGKPVPEDKIKGTTMVVAKDGLFVQDRGNKKTWVMTYKLDPSQKPKTITMTITEGERKGQTALGIYALEGDDLKLCYSLPGEERPTEFATKENGKQLLFVLKRDKNTEKDR
jgi:uncharacterized protein (TIGR03067 family)